MATTTSIRLPLRRHGGGSFRRAFTSTISLFASKQCNRLYASSSSSSYFRQPSLSSSSSSSSSFSTLSERAYRRAYTTASAGPEPMVAAAAASTSAKPPTEPAAAATAGATGASSASRKEESPEANSSFTEEEFVETHRELLILGCSEEVAQSYLKLGEKVYCKMSPAALDTTAYLEQLPLALQILDGTRLHEYEESDRTKMTQAAQSVFRNAARDLNKDGRVSFKEFVLWAAMAGKAKRGDKRGRLHIAFRLMDQDGNGYITLDELTAWVKIAINLGVISGTEAAKLDPAEIAQNYMGKYDSNWDGKISLPEFLEMGVLMDLDMLFLQSNNRKKN